MLSYQHSNFLIERSITEFLEIPMRIQRLCFCITYEEKEKHVVCMQFESAKNSTRKSHETVSIMKA